MTRVISSIPVLGKAWDQFVTRPWVRHSIDECKLTMRYRCLHPKRIRLEDSGATLFVDRLEPRGRRVLLGGASGQGGLKRLWKDAMTLLQPEIVIDVGLNYGEFLFATRYESAKLIIGIEANPLLASWLHQSLATHPDRDRIDIHMALASDRSDESKPFFVDASSSGRSSVICRNPDTCHEESVKTVAIDDLIKGVGDRQSPVLFKIDVEGYEPGVFEGMIEMIDQRRTIFGILEFNDALIEKAGFDPYGFLDMLASHFEIWGVPHNSPAQPILTADRDELRKILDSKTVELDLVVISKTAAVDCHDLLRTLQR